MKKLFNKVAFLFAALMSLSVATPEVVNAEDTVITFDFGNNGSASHNDGTKVSGTTKSYTEGNYTLNFTDITNMYTGARDAKGNSCLKLGASSVTGGFSFVAPDDVSEVIIYTARYKDKATKVTINGTTYTIGDASNDGKYTACSVDTSLNKDVKFTSGASSDKRCMIDKIEFVVSASAGPSIDDRIAAIATQETNFSLAFDYALNYVDQEVGEGEATEMTTTISFANTTHRDSWDSNQQTWSNEGVTFINEKAASTNAVIDSSNPVRLYANSKLTVTVGDGLNITSIVFNANTAAYATALQNSIGAANCTLDSKAVTVTPTETTSTYVIEKFTAQVRLDSIKVTYGGSGSVQVLDSSAFANVKLAIGASVAANFFDTFTNIKGGILLDAASKYENTTLAEAYADGEFKGVSTIKTGLTPSLDENETPVDYTIGTIVNIVEGLVNDSNISYLDYEFVGAVYFKLTDTEGVEHTVVLHQKKYSVRSMLEHYIANPTGIDSNNLKAINALNEKLG